MILREDSVKIYPPDDFIILRFLLLCVCVEGASSAGDRVLRERQRHRDRTGRNRQHFRLVAADGGPQGPQGPGDGRRSAGGSAHVPSCLCCFPGLNTSSVHSRAERRRPGGGRPGRVPSDHGLLPAPHVVPPAQRTEPGRQRRTRRECGTDANCWWRFSVCNIVTS